MILNCLQPTEALERGDLDQHQYTQWEAVQSSTSGSWVPLDHLPSPAVIAQDSASFIIKKVDPALLSAEIIA
ncbi:hypothetical protein EVAR_92891_1 [Eumeta japonica]|uniref:Uncharacterized protein n=1 Tax=Eumeta variegata TaxID=151549 RepID=A0A4C1TB69_EUMVA|nr:hypothetical protein EVAR_92891_1 [Eumeta japonica]